MHSHTHLIVCVCVSYPPMHNMLCTMPIAKLYSAHTLWAIWLAQFKITTIIMIISFLSFLLFSAHERNQLRSHLLKRERNGNEQNKWRKNSRVRARPKRRILNRIVEKTTQPQWSNDKNALVNCYALVINRPPYRPCSMKFLTTYCTLFQNRRRRMVFVFHWKNSCMPIDWRPQNSHFICYIVIWKQTSFQWKKVRRKRHCILILQP